MAPQYFRVHGGRLTLAECWRLARTWSALAKFIAWKCVGGYPFNFPIPRPEALHFVKPEEMPAGPYLNAALKLIAEFEGAGLKLLFTHRTDKLMGAPSLIACLLDPAGTTIGTFVSSSKGRGYEAECLATSHFLDGTAGVTTTCRKLFKPQPHHLYECRVRASPAGLIGRHRQNLERWERDGKFPKAFAPAELPKVILEAQQRYVDFHVARGVFVPLSEEEIALAAAMAKGRA
ncbi:MAG TPA: hypothetical protein VN641_11570 [Urbifossiella sp.]|nr:hypothetical protein [Urbifossiella sp.]